MDVNQVRFGNYTIGNQQASFGKKEEAKEESVKQQPAQEQNLQKFSADEFYSAMNIAGLQNKAQISFAKKEMSDEAINEIVAKYSTPEQQSRIEAMMGKFDNGVNQAAETIEQEFPGMFSSDSKLALAAKVFAQE